LRAAETPGIEGRTYHLGSGQEIRIGDLAQKIIHLSGRVAKISVDPQRFRPQGSEVLRLISDNSLARRDLGWQPQFGLDEGLSETIAWISSHLDLYRVGTYEF